MDTGDRYLAIKEAFLAVVDLDEAARLAWLDANCPTELRAEVQDLLGRHDRGPDLDTPAWAILERLAAEETEAATLVPLDTRLDEFRIIRRLGIGGMGEVYLAEDLVLKRMVAVKVLRRSTALSEVAIARFRQEAVTVAQLRHPSIVPIHRVGEAGDVHYLVMDLIAGPTLAAQIRIDRDGESPPTGERTWLRRQADLIAHIADALDHAHERDVIHRDVKPANIMIDADGTARLTDFGIAKNLRLEGVTVTGQLAGTVEYMSPEQASVSGITIDHRTDVYSLGVTLYEALTLQRPFTGETVEIVRQKVIQKPPPSIRSVNPAIDTDLATIVHKALEKRADDRYPSAGHLAADLRAWRDGRPILARPPSVWRRGREWARTHRSGVMAAGLLLLVSLATVLATLVLIQHRRNTTPLAVTADFPIDRLEIARADDVTGFFGASEELGRAPYTGRQRRGVYRITALVDGRSEAEAITFVPGPDDRIIDLRTGAPIVEPVSIALRRSIGDGDDMIDIPPGTLTTAHGPLRIEGFRIDRCEVTNAEYRAFLNANPGFPKPYHWAGDPDDGDPEDDWRVYDPALADRPVVGLTYHDAVAYAAWKGKRLPTEYEWEWAMRQPDLRLLPWSEEPSDLPEVPCEDARRVGAADWRIGLDLYRSYVLPVDSAPGAATPLGIRHAHSNVSEMTASLRLERGAVIVARGASWDAEPRDLADFVTLRPWNTSSTVRGFRCIVTRRTTR